MCEHKRPIAVDEEYGKIILCQDCGEEITEDEISLEVD